MKLVQMRGNHRISSNLSWISRRYLQEEFWMMVWCKSHVSNLHVLKLFHYYWVNLNFHLVTACRLFHINVRYYKWMMTKVKSIQKITRIYRSSLVSIRHCFPDQFSPKFKVMNCEYNPCFTQTIMHILILKQPCNGCTRPVMTMNHILQKNEKQYS